MFPGVVKVGVILFIWDSVHAVLGTKLGCSRLPAPHLWFQREDRCYRVRSEAKRQYVPGRDWCKTQCSDYATPNFQEENDWILEKFKEHYPDTPPKLWIGCNNTLGQVECLGDTAEKYRNWQGKREPTTSNTCVYMNRIDGSWGTASSCGSPGKWTMCEAPAQPPISPLKVRCNVVAIPSGKCPQPNITFSGMTPMQCCLTCAKQCNCRSFSLTPGTQDCNINPDKINDPNPELIEQTCEYYEHEIQK